MNHINCFCIILERYQAGICSFGDQIVAVGGCTSWNCINSVEVYNPEEDKWTNLAPLNVPRRGAGVAMFKGN